MIPLIVILIIAAFLLDMFLTYNYLETYKERYPKNDWTLAEANPILRSCLKQYGLKEGMMLGGGIIFIILLILIVLINENWRHFLLGLYFMTNAFHLANWNALKRLKLTQSKGGK